MNLGMTNKTLVKYFLELTETSLTEKQAETAAEIIREAVKKDFLEALEKSEDKLEFLNNEAKEQFWSDTDHCAGNWFFNYGRIHDHIIKKNATEKRDQEISFKIIPTVEGWEKIKKVKIKYPAFTQSDKLIEQFLEFYGINEFRK